MNIYEIKTNYKDAKKICSLIDDKSFIKINYITHVSDLSWSLKNAKSYHLVGCCGTLGVHIFHFKIIKNNSDFSKIDIIKINRLDSQISSGCRATWNFMVSLFLI